MDRCNEEGFFSFNEVARKINMNPGQLKGMIDMFEHMGHIEKEQENCSSSFEGCKSNCFECKKYTTSRGAVYKLTEKEKRVCGLG